MIKRAAAVGRGLRDQYLSGGGRRRVPDRQVALERLCVGRHGGARQFPSLPARVSGHQPVAREFLALLAKYSVKLTWFNRSALFQIRA